MQEKMTPQEFEAWNETMAQRYDPDAFITRTALPVRLIAAMRIKRACEALRSGPEDAVLDVGCGPGNLTEKLTGRRVVGVDLSEALLANARRRFQGRPEVELIKADAEHLPFEDGSFDKIICSEVLEHMQDPAQALREMRRVIRGDGTLVITLPNEAMINRAKGIILRLGLKKWIAGGYGMSDDMTEEWHRSETPPAWLIAHAREFFTLERCEAVPFRLAAFHHVFRFRPSQNQST